MTNYLETSNFLMDFVDYLLRERQHFMGRKPGQKRKTTDSDAASAFGLRFSAMLKRKGISQSDCARMIDTSKSTISAWSAGHIPTSPSLLLELCKKISTPEDPISFQEILTGEKETLSLQGLDLSQQYDRVEFLSGLCEVTIKRLVKKGQKE